MFEELIARIRRAQTQFDFELVNTLDPYRLDHLLDQYQHAIQSFQCEAETMVKELEEL